MIFQCLTQVEIGTKHHLDLSQVMVLQIAWRLPGILSVS